MKNILKHRPKKLLFFILIIPSIIQLILINIIQSITIIEIYYLLFLFFWSFYLPYFYWYNKAVSFLFEYLNSNFNLKIIYFKLSLITTILTSINFVAFVAYLFSFVFFKNKNFEPNTNALLYMFLIQFIGIISFIYCVYFSSKLIESIDIQKKTYSKNILANFLALSFPPTTIIIIQNKIKDILSRV